VVLPHIGFDGAAGEWLARNLHNVSLRVNAGIGDGGYHEAHVSAGAPEAAGELVREDESGVAAFTGKQGEGFFSAGPGRANMILKPAAELEPVKLSLIEQQTQ
jgi:hypothetical protein